MSSNIHQGGEKASQLLNFNMENISHELSTLLVGGELDSFGAIASASLSGNTNEARAYGGNVYAPLNYRGAMNNDSNYGIECTAIISGAAPAQETKETRILQLYLQCQYQQQLQHQRLDDQQHTLQRKPQNFLLQQNFNSSSQLYEVGPSSSAFTHRFSGDEYKNSISSRHQIKPFSHDIAANAYIISGGVSPKNSPKFEFHFLRCQSSNKSSLDAKAIPLISSAARTETDTEFFNTVGRHNSIIGGNSSSIIGQRKFAKQQTDEEIDYNKIVVDMSVLALSLDNKELNPVLRLFGVFRKMHYYLNDTLSESFADEYRGITHMKCPMPCTMNVQYQVKQVTRKCIVFLYEMQRILNVNKIYGLNLYLECEQSLNMLRKLLAQVEAFRRIEMEHKRGQFVTEEARVHSQKLEILLEQLSDQIRETHIYVHAFNWAVERTKHSTLYSKIKEQQIPATNDFDWVAKDPNEIPMTSTSFDTTINNIGANERYDDGRSLQPDNYDRGIAVFTTNCNEFDIERQSTRYIGYK